MSGTVILSHGSNSGPDATKVSALAKVAESLGWNALRPDFRDDDAKGEAASVQPRIDKTVALMRDAPRPLWLVGSSMGAFTSGLASLVAPCDGLLLVALPMAIPDFPHPFGMLRGVPAMLIHGYHDTLCPVATAQRSRSRAVSPRCCCPTGIAWSNICP